MRLSTKMLGGLGGLIFAFEATYLMTHTPGGNVDYGWAQLGAWLGGLMLASALLKLVLWDNQSWGQRK